MKLLDQLDRRWLDNANTPDEYRAATGTSPGQAATTKRTLHVQYYAVLRDRDSVVFIPPVAGG